MSFLKLDDGILDSSLWVDHDATRVFVTAGLMATPHELEEPTPQLQVRALGETGFVVPRGWYGLVAASGTGIVRRAMIDLDVGLEALERLGSPDPESRSADFEGRRLVRVDGGYLILNLIKYRDRDHTAAERAKRYRDRHKGNGVTSQRHGVTKRDGVTKTRDVTYARYDSDSASGKGKSARKGKHAATWLTPIAEAHEKIFGEGSFGPMAGRFAKAWRPLVDAHGAEKCAKVWAFAMRPSDPERKFRNVENVAARFAEFDPDAIISDAERLGTGNSNGARSHA